LQTPRPSRAGQPARLNRWIRGWAAVTAILTGLLSAEAANAPARIRLGTLVPKGSSAFRHLQVMGEKWRQAPGGGAALTIYPDGTMGGEADMVRRMRVGQLQAGALTVVGLSEIERAVTGLQYMPMMFRTLEEVDWIGQQLQPQLEARLREKGFEVLSWGDAGWVRFFSKQPVLTPDDLKKQKLFVWTGSPEAVDIYKSGGFNPVPLDTIDILPNLQTGLITAVPLPPFYALAGQVDTTAPNMLELNWGPLVGATVITRKTWDALPAEAKPVMKAAALEAGNQIKADNRREATEAVDAMKKRGLTVHPVTSAMEAEWRASAESVYPRIRGRLVPADIFDEVVRLLEKYRRQPPGPR
jgi:TRAP-type C4-dicarboxylate transport system substrate-binding protein